MMAGVRYQHLLAENPKCSEMIHILHILIGEAKIMSVYGSEGSVQSLFAFIYDASEDICVRTRILEEIVEMNLITTIHAKKIVRD